VLGVFLPRGSVARGGDVLVAEDGSLVKVVAAPQPVLVAGSPGHGSPLDLMHAAYHLGNRHVALELPDEHLQIEADPVLVDRLRRMHLVVREEVAPFESEGGACAAHADHGHDAHAQGARAALPHRSERPDHAHDHGRVHVPGCKHDHH